MTSPSGSTASAAATLLERLGVPGDSVRGGTLPVRSPIDGAHLADVVTTPVFAVSAKVDAAHEAHLRWRNVPAPKRGDLMRAFAGVLRAHKDDLGALVTLEAGKVTSEGLGEVQEMIDIAEFAMGLSRQVGGLTLPSERPNHRMMETWHPLGVTGIISAFNFPVAVWSWNAALALVCGNTCLWKPSEKTPLTALATSALFARAVAACPWIADALPTPELRAGLSSLVLGGPEVGEALVDHPKVPLVSATGSTAMGRKVGARVAGRFGRALLELGGNNAAIVAPSADLELAVRAIAFAALGTAGQRCTTLRRLLVVGKVYDALVPRLKKVYESVQVGDPREAQTLVGPLIDEGAAKQMAASLQEARSLGGAVMGGERLDRPGVYVRPALVEMPTQRGPMTHETFAPILYVMRIDSVEQGITLNNEVAQGLSSCIFTNDVREAELFVSARGSDCGIANVNIGTSGAEIGGAFGGEKETGGGREAGSDSWKAYMRRQTNTINYGHDLPLAQGVRFDI